MNNKSIGSSEPQRSPTGTASVDNRANQLNPNNGAYWSSRDLSRPVPAANGSVPPAGGTGADSNSGSNTNTGK